MSGDQTIDVGRDRFGDLAEGLTWDPPVDQLADGPASQADFAVNVIAEAFAAGVVEGAYSVQLVGQWPGAEEEGGRKGLRVLLSPIDPATPDASAVDEAELTVKEEAAAPVEAATA